jgi:hypothetical protein
MENINILRWDVVENPCTNELRPMLYFTPSVGFLNEIHSNPNWNDKIVIDISGVDGYYNGNGLFATLDKSKWIPNCRPNFFAKTGSYILILDDVLWNGYPYKNLGRFKLSNKILN